MKYTHKTLNGEYAGKGRLHRSRSWHGSNTPAKQKAANEADFCEMRRRKYALRYVQLSTSRQLNCFRMYPATSLMGRRTCSMLSRSRMVTD